MERQSKILVVDDDQFSLWSIARALGGESYQVVTVASGSEAIDLLKQGSFDLVLADLKMPGVDGLEVLRQARKIAPQTVVLILTAYASMESAIEALREGAYDYLVKPCSDDELKLKIAKGLERVHLEEERKQAEEALRELNASLKARTFDLQVLHELSQQIGYTLNYDELFRLMIEQLHRAVSYDVSASLLMTNGQCELFIRPRRPLSPAIQQEVQERLVSTFATMGSQSVDVERLHIRFLEGPMSDEIGPPVARLRSVFQVPLIVGEERETVGLLFVGSEREGAFTEDKVRLLYTVANQASVSIQRLHALLAAEQRLAQERGTLLDIAKATTSTLDMAEVLKLVTQRAAHACGADRCTLLLLDKGGKTLTPAMSQFASGKVDEKMWQLFKDTRYHRLLAEVPEARQVLQENCPLFISDVLASSLPRYWIESFNVKSLLIVPMISKGRPIGVLGLDHTEGGKGFAAEQASLAMTIGAQAAIAIENAQLYDAAQRELAERKIAEEELKRTMAELARSNKELEQFAYVASHDLREPLRMVTSYVQLLARRYQGRLDADANEFIAYAVDGATRMQALINDLLAYSRVGTRGKPFEPTDCETILEQALTNLQVAIEESGAAVTHDPLPTVVADGTQLVQLFQNLIGNAIKFRSEEPPRVHVSASETFEVSKTSKVWRVSVQDNGIGIDPEYHERIFLIFQRLHTREEYPGTGIGLAVCKKIVERHGGRIWVESQFGKGSTFHFTIPVIEGK